MNLQDLIDGVKRDSQTGETGNNLDLTAADIIRQFNLASAEFWEFDDWDWSKVDISVSLAAGTTAVQTLASTVGRILVLGLQNLAGELKIISEREYRQSKQDVDSTPNQVWAAVLRGRDASGNLKVLFVDPPSDALVIEGQGKARISEYAASDISTLGAIPYFPKETHQILYDWTLARFWLSIKDVRGPNMLQSVMGRLKAMTGRMKTQPANQDTTPLPSYITFVKRRRGGRTVV